MVKDSIRIVAIEMMVTLLMEMDEVHSERLKVNISEKEEINHLLILDIQFMWSLLKNL